nr:MAG TPA: Porphobilinogen deaminase, C-terminal domain [Caudoviricetes sp.]
MRHTKVRRYISQCDEGCDTPIYYVYIDTSHPSTRG